MNVPAPIPAGVLALLGDAAQRQRQAEQRCLDLLVSQGFRLVMLPVLEFEQEEKGAGYRLIDRSGRVMALRTQVIPLAGSVELAVRLGLADAEVDLVETGRTLRENGLHPVEEWLRVAPDLIANRAAFYVSGDEIRALRRTLGGQA
ncbi:MAG: ATP phosphoribosyltransferase regulatory subunit [Acidobacteriota bacterium]